MHNILETTIDGIDDSINNSLIQKIATERPAQDRDEWFFTKD